MSRNRIEPPIDLLEFSTFTADLDLRALSPDGVSAATYIRVITAGAGSMAVRMEAHEYRTRQLTALLAGEELLGRFVSIELENAKAEARTWTAAEIAAAGGLTDADTLTLKVDGGGTETATFNTGDFSDITAPTLAELKTVIEADTTAEFDATGTNGLVNSPTGGSAGDIQITGGLAAAKLGLLDTTVHVGADTDITKIRVGWPAQ